MSKGEKETKMKTSPRIQAKSAEYRKAIAANDRKYREMIEIREAQERGEWWMYDDIGKN